MTTIFSKIVAGEIPCKKVYEDDLILAFHDIAPKAPVHVLVIPKSGHLKGIGDATMQDVQLLGHMCAKIAEIANTLGLSNGYRVLTNNGSDSGQEVPHLHFHILGGKRLAGLNG